MRLEKKSILEELRKNLTAATFIIVVNYQGMKAVQANDLRKRLVKTRSRLQVVSNTNFRRVVMECHWGDPRAALTGPTAVIFGQGDVIETAKLIAAFFQDQRLPVIQMGILNGAFLSAQDVDTLVKLPSRPVLYSMLVGTLAAPMTRLVGVLQQKVASLVYVLNAIQEKKNQTS